MVPLKANRGATHVAAPAIHRALPYFAPHRLTESLSHRSVDARTQVSKFSSVQKRPLPRRCRAERGIEGRVHTCRARHPGGRQRLHTAQRCHAAGASRAIRPRKTRFER